MKMRESRLKAQIKRDSEAVSRISASARDSYNRELKATLDRGSSYRFSASGSDFASRRRAVSE